MSSSSFVKPAVLWSMGAWLAFGTVEIVLLSFVPWATARPNLVVTVHPGFTFLLLLIYAAIGALCGAVADRILRDRSAAVLEAAGTVSVLAVYSILQLLFLPAQSMARLGVITAPFLLAACVLSLRGGRTFAWLSPARNPWTSAPLLFMPPWIATAPLAERPAWLVGAVILTAVSVSFAAATAILRLLKQRHTGSGPRRLAFAAALALLFALLAVPLRQQPVIVATAPARPVPAGKPPVILLILDTVRADRLSVYGYERDTTPNLREFAREAVRYTNAHSSGDMTLTSHASLFTGLYGSHHGAHRSARHPGGSRLDAAHVTLAEILTSRGYDSALVAANTAFLSEFHGLGQGFGVHDHRAPVPFLGAVRPYSLRSGIRGALVACSRVPDQDQVTRRAGEINTEVYRQIDRMRASGRPFLLAANYMDAHWPYVPPAPFLDRFPGRDTSFRLQDYYALAPKVMVRGQPLTPAEQRHMSSQYDGSIAYVDAEIGNLLRRLKDIGLYDNSLVIVTSDHGEAFGERKLVGHGVAVYEELIRVPC